MRRAPSLLLVLWLVVAACDGADPTGSPDAPPAAEDTAADTASVDTEPVPPALTCDDLLLENAGIPGGYPFALGADADRRAAALAALAALSDAYGVETINGPSLAPFTCTPSWQTTFDLTPIPGESGRDALEGALEAFLSGGDELFAFDGATAAEDSGAETETGHFRFRYTQTYCGEVLANAAVAAGGHLRGSFAAGLQWADHGILIAEVRKDGMIQTFTDLLVPPLIRAPLNPVVDGPTAAAALAGERLDAHACFGPGGHTLKANELGEVGDPVLLLLGTGDGLQLHLAWPVGVYLEGPTTAYVDALTGAPLAWALHFACD